MSLFSRTSFQAIAVKFKSLVSGNLWKENSSPKETENFCLCLCHVHAAQEQTGVHHSPEHTGVMNVRIFSSRWTHICAQNTDDEKQYDAGMRTRPPSTCGDLSFTFEAAFGAKSSQLQTPICLIPSSSRHMFPRAQQLFDALRVRGHSEDVPTPTSHWPMKRHQQPKQMCKHPLETSCSLSDTKSRVTVQLMDTNFTSFELSSSNGTLRPSTWNMWASCQDNKQPHLSVICLWCRIRHRLPIPFKDSSFSASCRRCVASEFVGLFLWKLAKQCTLHAIKDLLLSHSSLSWQDFVEWQGARRQISWLYSLPDMRFHAHICSEKIQQSQLLCLNR